MDSILFWAGALVVVTVLSPVLRIVIAAVAGKQIGATALAKQPDTIHLERRDPSAWKSFAQVRQIVGPLRTRGFVDAGVHAIREMPGLLVQLLAHPGEGLYAAVYEHPKAGIWLDLVSLFQDGTSSTFSTSPPTALAQRPGHPSVNMHGKDPITVLDKALAERGSNWLVKVSPDQAVKVFEQAYADAIAWRKQTGISTGEVVKTALRKVA